MRTKLSVEIVNVSKNRNTFYISYNNVSKTMLDKTIYSETCL